MVNDNFKVIFIDTNIFLHYQMFSVIDWCSIVRAEEVKIIIPKTVINELDKHKYNQSLSNKERQRAKEVVKKFFDLHQSGKQDAGNLVVSIKSNIKISWDVSELNCEFLKKFNLDPDSQDDQILASIISFKQENSNIPVIFITEDFNSRLKASYHKIETICLPDEYKLSDELTEDEKRIKELERENLELKRRIPELKLCFKDGSDHHKFSISQPISSSFNEEEFLKNLQEKYPKIAVEEFDDQDTHETSETQPRILPDDISDYNSKLDKFYIEFKKYEEDYRKLYKFFCITTEIDLIIKNTGTVPAKDIHVLLHFPDGFTLREYLPSIKLTSPKLPEKPVPRKPPKITFPSLVEASRKLQTTQTTQTIQIPYQNPSSSSIPNVSSPKIQRSNSYDVEIEVQKVKQGMSESFKRMFIIFNSFETASNFQIDYRIIAANAPKEFTGKLHVIIDKKFNT